MEYTIAEFLEIVAAEFHPVPIGVQQNEVKKIITLIFKIAICFKPFIFNYLGTWNRNAARSRRCFHSGIEPRKSIAFARITSSGPYPATATPTCRQRNAPESFRRE